MAIKLDVDVEEIEKALKASELQEKVTWTINCLTSDCND